MFKRKARPLSKERLRQALSARPASPANAGEASLKASRSQRQHLWVPCSLSWPPGVVAEGICLDISASGARIRNRKTMHVPTRFHFHCVRLGIDAPARLVRQDGVDIAIQFEEKQPV
ncbi:PilZ domain-containing protein [Henriciella aquimarina]|uniref:PilZ domain-containing protein n=1 Tax=Henriciella aquimarina TaxID=545261 RepID=UPI000A01619A|nr:PilZ domain-containing protein [Henriciella aquimarina]